MRKKTHERYKGKVLEKIRIRKKKKETIKSSLYLKWVYRMRLG
jgi:hypothetical protein